SFWAGVLSVGLSGRVRGAYRFLCEQFTPGDQIYLFGFSRGGFEARLLAELIATVGLVHSDNLDQARRAWQHYRRYRSSPKHQRLKRFQQETHFPVRIRCVGVWDTVGNLPLPFVHRHHAAHVSALPGNVDVALHALAIDETRGPYRPLLWTSKSADAPATQIIEQAWFPGSHVDVGGGGESSALADAALLWMAKRVSEATELAVNF